MAKRIKVKGKAPRGLSKATRQIDAAQEALDRSGVHMSIRSPKRSDAELAKIAGRGRGITKPSSTRKKLVKEGNRKFIGPRAPKEFDPYEEIDSPDESVHRLSRGYTKSQRRSDEAEFLRRRPQNRKLSRAEQNMLKRDIAGNANSRQGKLLKKLMEAIEAQEAARYEDAPF